MSSKTPIQQAIEIPIDGKDKETLTRVEAHLSRKGFKFKKKGRLPDYTLIVTVESAQDAFWIGCNFVAISNKIYDGPLTTTG